MAHGSHLNFFSLHNPYFKKKKNDWTIQKEAIFKLEICYTKVALNCNCLQNTNVQTLKLIKKLD